MRAKKQAIVECVGSWAMLQYFPAERDARTAIMRIIDAMATTTEQVDWLAAEMITRFNEWPGPQALRALFCTRFKPADGKEENSSGLRVPMAIMMITRLEAILNVNSTSSSSGGNGNTSIAMMSSTNAGSPSPV